MPDPHKPFSFLHFLPAIGWFLLIAVLLCLPGNDLPKAGFFAMIPQFDKLVHVCLFAIFCFLCALPLRKSGLPAGLLRQKLLLILLCGMVYGVLMEFVQRYWIPGRSFELADIGADALGCLLGYAIARKCFIHKAV